MKFASLLLLGALLTAAGCRPATAPGPANSPPVKPVKPVVAAPDPETEPKPEAVPAEPAETVEPTGPDAVVESTALPAIAWLRDHDQAYAEAKRLQKPLLIDFWCGT